MKLKVLILALAISQISAAGAVESTASTITDADLKDNKIPVEQNSLTGEKIYKVQHPNAAKGLITIDKEKNYQYKVPLREKTSGSTFGVGAYSPPNITTSLPNGSTLTYKSMYGNSSIYGLSGNYEWMPFKKIGTLGLVAESGVMNVHGHGVLFSGDKAMEGYSLFIVPITLMVKYRFEYKRRQAIVPFVEGGASYYGFLEYRDDGKYKLAGSEAAGGGGGLMFNISRWDDQSAFRLDREMGIADLWITLSARGMVGLKQSMDMTTTVLLAGVTVDY